MENINDIFAKFSRRLKSTLIKAQDLATTLNKSEINFWDILYVLSVDKGSIAYNFLSDIGISENDLKIEIAKNSNIDDINKNGIPIFSNECQKIIERAVKLAYQNEHPYVGTEHLLYAIFDSNIKELDNFLSNKKINKETLLKNIDALLVHTDKLTDIVDSNLSNISSLEKMITGNPFADQLSMPQFTIELTDHELQKKIDPVIGRKKEIDRLIQILCRRTKNNPILLGEPGVGKTAIVEGLAKKILSGDVPDVLLGKKIIALDLGAVISGTMYRGEFEKRLKGIIDDAKKDDNIILFIDEIHTIIGAGATSGQLDAANILKPELAKGDVKVIGATTINEYKKYIESDPAFERRFQSILIDEPSAVESRNILFGLRLSYEKYHRVEITDGAIESAIELSERYLSDRFLPDKAIDLLDEAASKFKVKKSKDPRFKKVQELKNELSNIIKDKEESINKDDYEGAIVYKEREDKIIEELNNIEKKNKAPKKPLGKITEIEIAEIISRMTSIPLEDLMKSEKKKLVNLEKSISEFIIGQDVAVKEISQYIRRAKAGLANPNKPLASFIFLGPTGVGKTEMAKVLAKYVYNDEKALIRIDMSEFSEKFNASKLIGSPAGYIGYKDQNKFTDLVRIKPYSIILFDEIEKAHPDIFNLLLPILEDGYITDAQSRKINFKNTIIIMTSNIASDKFNKQASFGFSTENKNQKEFLIGEYEALEKRVIESLSDHFKPEFINRIDKTLVFKPLDIKSVSEIAKIHIEELSQRLSSRKIYLSVEKNVFKYLAEKSYDPKMGARPLKRFIQDKIENLIANKILSDNIKSGNHIKAVVRDGEIKIEKI